MRGGFFVIFITLSSKRTGGESRVSVAYAGSDLKMRISGVYEAPSLRREKATVIEFENQREQQQHGLGAVQ
jgi:hypothetical protein